MSKFIKLLVVEDGLTHVNADGGLAEMCNR